MKNDRVRMFMDVTFKYGDKEFTTDVYIPFTIFIEAVRSYCESRMVTMDGTDTAIWNLLVDFNCLSELEDNSDILSKCRELYKGSAYEEEDYEEWKDEYEFDNNLGSYAEEE